MNRTMIRAGLVALSLVSALGFAACKQGLGNRCQIDSDCEDGLRCDSVGRVLTGATCVSTGGDLASTADFAGPVDMSNVD